jgi:putative MFS transporter
VSDSPARAPGWIRIFPFLRPPDDLTAHQWRILGLLGITVLINHYDAGLLTATLLQIQTELGIPENEIGGVVGFVRFGGVPALALAVMADRLGRRRLLFGTILAFTVCTVATAFAQTPAQFRTFQFLARMFVGAEEILAVVVIAEELGARRRGFALGVLAALGSLGNGISFIALAWIEELPYGWRTLYAFGAAPLLLLAWLRRSLPETQRFEQERAQREAAHREHAALQPVLDLLTRHPGRVLALCAMIVPSAMIMIAAATFPAKFLQQEHGWTPAQIPLLMVIGGVLVFWTMALSGAIADRIGRRMTAVVGYGLNGVGLVLFYNGAGWVVVPGWILMMAGLVACDVLYGALGGELFPTAFRSTASGVRAVAWVGGGWLGLQVEGWLYPLVGSHAEALTWMLAGAWIAPLVVLTAIPETARRELEEIAPG